MPLAKHVRRVAARLHVWLYRTLRGRLVSMGHRLVIVTTKGAKTNRLRTTPLVAFPRSDGWIVVAASSGRRNPGWYHNMLAHPDVVVEKDAHSAGMVAREVVGAEREAMWRSVLEEEPAYASFQEKTERVIPIMLLEPPASLRAATPQAGTGATDERKGRADSVQPSERAAD